MSKKSRSKSSEGPLACPSCAARYGLDERFCADCGMPLVYTGRVSAEPGEARVRARKIDPRYTEGELVRIAGGRNQAEAELIQNLLIEEGVPSVLRRTRGFDVPDMLAAGPRDVMVPASAAEAAREILLEADIAPAPAALPGPTGQHSAVLAAAILGGGLLATGLAWLLLQTAT